MRSPDPEDRMATYRHPNLLRKALLGLMAGLLLGGCAAEKDASLARIRRQGRITFAMGKDFPPFYYHDEKNDLIGFEVDVAREIAGRLGVQLELVNVEWTQIIDGLLAEKYDGILSSMAVTEERSARVAFTVPYYYSGAQLFVRSNAPFSDIADLKNARIGVAAGTTYETDAKQTLGGIVEHFDNAEEAIEALTEDRVQGVVTDSVVGMYLTNIDGNRFKPLGRHLRREAIAAAFRKEDQALLHEVNQILEEISRDETLTRLMKKVAGQEYPL